MNEQIDGSSLQFLVDSTFKTELPHYQMELICLSILNGSALVNRGIPKTDLYERADEIYKLWDAIKANRLVNEMAGSSSVGEKLLDIVNGKK
jgi:hypothetical protein